MNFLLTTYFYPLREPKQLSKNLRFMLDNPRTEKEIGFVRDYAKKIFERTPDLERLATNIKQFLEILLFVDHTIGEFRDQIGGLESFEVLARMWVIARYDDEGTWEPLAELARKEGLDERFGLVLLPDNHPIEVNSRKLSDFCHLISLLIYNKGSYTGESFILDARADWSLSGDIIYGGHQKTFAVQKSLIVPPEGLSEADPLWFYPAAAWRLTETISLLDAAFEIDQYSKLLISIASMLRAAGEDVHDIKTKILILVGIIEAILTHNPDTNRFNVEDSINRQFQLKASLLVYLDDRSKHIQYIRMQMRKIYGLRSAIAHGDYAAVEKFETDEKKNGIEYPLGNATLRIYAYLRAIVIMYLKDPMLVTFLKAS